MRRRDLLRGAVAGLLCGPNPRALIGDHDYAAKVAYVSGRFRETLTEFIGSEAPLPTKMSLSIAYTARQVGNMLEDFKVKHVALVDDGKIEMEFVDEPAVQRWIARARELLKKQIDEINAGLRSA